MSAAATAATAAASAHLQNEANVGPGASQRGNGSAITCRRCQKNGREPAVVFHIWLCAKAQQRGRDVAASRTRRPVQRRSRTRLPLQVGACAGQ